MKTTYQNLWAAAKAMLRGKNTTWRTENRKINKTKPKVSSIKKINKTNLLIDISGNKGDSND